MNLKHPETLLHFSKIELAAALGNLRYDSLAEHINFLADDLYSQADLDFGRGRYQLCQSLWKDAEQA